MLTWLELAQNSWEQFDRAIVRKVKAEKDEFVKELTDSLKDSRVSAGYSKGMLAVLNAQGSDFYGANLATNQALVDVLWCRWQSLHTSCFK